MEAKKQTVHVWAQHQTALRLFSRSLSQLRTTAMGGIVGLDYMAVDRVANWMGITMDSVLLGQIQWMESELVALTQKQ